MSNFRPALTSKRNCENIIVYMERECLKGQGPARGSDTKAPEPPKPKEENLTKEQKASRQFKETAEKNGITLVAIGDVLVLPFSVLSTNISPKLFLIGASPKLGIMQIDSGNKDLVEKAILDRMVQYHMGGTNSLGRERFINGYNQGKPPEKQVHEGIREKNTILGKKAELVVLNNLGFRYQFITSAVKLSPREKAVETAMTKNQQVFQRLAVSTDLSQKR